MAWDPRDGLRSQDVDEELLDLRNVMEVAWPQIGWDPPSRGQLLIADAVQRALTDPDAPTDMIVQAWRGAGKSAVLGLTCLWVWLWDQRQKVLILSGTEEKAQELAYFVRRLFDRVDIFEHLQPKRGTRDTIVGFDVRGAPIDQSKSLRISSITGTVVGGRADLIIPDDIEVPNTSLTVHMRERLRTSYLQLNALLRPEGMRKKLILGTPQCEETIYDWMVNERGARMTIVPLVYPDQELFAYYGSRMHPEVRAELQADPSLEGQPVDPDRFPESECAKILEDNTPSYYRQQYLLDARLVDEEQRPLKLRDLLVIDSSSTHAHERYVWAPDDDRVWSDDIPCVGLHRDRYHRPMKALDPVLPYENKILAVDPSGSGLDETGFAVVGVLNGSLHLLDVGGFLDGHGEETLTALAEKMVEWELSEAVVEDNWGDGMFGRLLTGAVTTHVPWPAAVRGLKVSGRKEERILRRLAPLTRSHRLVVNAEALRRDFRQVPLGVHEDRRNAYRFAYQFSRMTYERNAIPHDDRLEALSIASEYLERYLLPTTGDPQQQRDALRDFQEKARKGMAREVRKPHLGRVSRGGTRWEFDREVGFSMRKLKLGRGKFPGDFA